MTKEELYNKAKSLPLLPGIYIIKDKTSQIIYIGKAKRLKTRVSQYFKKGAVHAAKVQKMVDNSFDFDVIVTNTEFEALTLECSQIKQHSPKYNILLKDDKGYNFIKISKEEYPRITAEFQALDDSKYLGPYMSSFAVREMVSTAQQIFKLPTCTRVFPRDFKKERPCLNFYIEKCMGVCTGKIKKADYNEIIDSATKFLKQDSEKIVKILTENMQNASENLNFEKAALIRDQITAIEKLKAGQNVVSEALQNHDFISVCGSANNSAVSVLRYRRGRLVDKKEHIFLGEENLNDVRDEFLIQFYAMEMPAKVVFLDEMPQDEEIINYIQKKAGYKVSVSKPMKGENTKIIKMAYTNAVETLARQTGRVDKSQKLLDEFANLLGLKTPPKTIESYDISNWGDDSSVGGMIVLEHGKPKKSGYRKFKIKTVEGTDDYKSMQEVLTRRIMQYTNGAQGQFGIKPDLILLDGGKGHLSAVLKVVDGTDFSDVPIFGMVKDKKHRTKAIVSKDGEIAIAMHKGIFKFVTQIQDEVHRFSIEYQRKTQKTKSYAVTLTKISGIGENKARLLMDEFSSLANIKQQEIQSLEKVKGISKTDAKNIYAYFNE